jgi:transposase
MELRDAARASRRSDGLSAREIGERLGVPSRTVARWLAGLPVPEWTRRPNAKDEARDRALTLRAEGWWVPDIAAEVGVSWSTAWLWVRDRSLDPAGERVAAGVARRRAAVRAAWDRRLAETDQQRRAAHHAAAGRAGDLNDADLLRVGAMMYWCEVRRRSHGHACRSGSRLPTVIRA